MDVTPTTAQTRPNGGKSGAAKNPAAAKSKTAAKGPNRRKVATEQVQAENPDSETHEERQLIATTAYFMAAARGFEPGHEVEDWLEAERRVRTVS